MFLQRATLVAFATVFTVGMTSMASACCNMGYAAQVTYAAPAYAAPTAYLGTGCGACGTPSPAVIFAQPVAPAPAPMFTAGCGCRAPITYNVAPTFEPTPVAPAPIYVVNQGPDYTGPGVMVPYHTWTPPVAYAAPSPYPYV